MMKMIGGHLNSYHQYRIYKSATLDILNKDDACLTPKLHGVHSSTLPSHWAGGNARTMLTGCLCSWRIKTTEVQLFAAFYLSCSVIIIFVWVYSVSSFYCLPKKVLIWVPSCCVFCEWESKRNKNRRTISWAKG